MTQPFNTSAINNPPAFRSLWRRWMEARRSSRRRRLAAWAATIEAVEIRMQLSAVSAIAVDSIAPQIFEHARDMDQLAPGAAGEQRLTADGRFDSFGMLENAPSAFEVTPELGQRFVSFDVVEWNFPPQDIQPLGAFFDHVPVDDQELWSEVRDSEVSPPFTDWADAPQHALPMDSHWLDAMPTFAQMGPTFGVAEHLAGDRTSDFGSPAFLQSLDRSFESPFPDFANAPSRRLPMVNPFLFARLNDDHQGPPPGAIERLAGNGLPDFSRLPFFDGPRPDGPRGAFERRPPPDFVIAMRFGTFNEFPPPHVFNSATGPARAGDEQQASSPTQPRDANLSQPQSPNRPSVVSNNGDFGGLIDISENRSNDAANREAPSPSNVTAPAVSSNKAVRRATSADSRRAPSIFAATREGGFIELFAMSANETHGSRTAPQRHPNLQRHDQLDAAIGRFVAFERADDPTNGQQVFNHTRINASSETVEPQPSSDNAASLTATVTRLLSLGIAVTWLKFSLSSDGVSKTRWQTWRSQCLRAANSVVARLTIHRRPNVIR